MNERVQRLPASTWLHIRNARWTVFSLGTLQLLLTVNLYGQPSLETQQAFLDLTRDEVLMDLSAHPDDEDGATLAYYRMKYGIKTYSVLFTRGEGGQNEIGPELYEELGVLRSAETELAGIILGTDVRFLNFMDFGYSKTATEAFQVWGGQREVLRRLVYIIRKLRPDVIFTNHSTIDGHGHHQAVAITAIAAFDAAGDSTYFPEQLQERGLCLWQPRKLFFRSFGRSDGAAVVVNSTDELNIPRNVSYSDLAIQALSMHRTQGGDKVDVRRFSRWKSLYRPVRQNSLYESDSTSFFSGIDIWNDPGMAPLRPIRLKLSSLSATSPRDSTLSTVSSALQMIDSVREASVQSTCALRVLDQWESELEQLVRILCRLNVSFTLKDNTVVPKQKVESSLALESSDCTLDSVKLQFTLPQGWSINEPVGLSAEMDEHEFKKGYTLIVSDAPLLSLPKARAQYRPIDEEQNITVLVSIRLNGILLRTSCSPDFDVAPPQTLTVTPNVAHISASRPAKGKTFQYQVKNYLPHKTAGWVRCLAPAGWKTERAAYIVSTEDSTATGSIFVVPPDTVKSGEDTLRFRSDFSSDDVIVRIFDVAVPSGLTVGIVKSYDTTLEAAAEELGVQYRLLEPNDIESGDLSKYKTILVDIRAYLVRDDLERFNNRLLEYVRKGGNLVVMYQREQEWKTEYAPYPFHIGRRRVTVEEAPIEVLQPQHPLFSKPNIIRKEDWMGWKQERGVHFPEDVAPEYTRLLSSHDPDEGQLTTGYLVANVGKGSYIYSSLVWYRQLKEMIPGAFRCLANMIAYPLYRQ